MHDQWGGEVNIKRARYIYNLRVSAFARGRQYKQGESELGKVVVVVV